MYSTHKKLKLNAETYMHHHDSAGEHHYDAMHYVNNGEHQSDAMLHIHMEGSHLQTDSSMFSDPLPPELPEPVIESYDLVGDIKKGLKKLHQLIK